MAAIAKTAQTVRDNILRSVGALNSDVYEDLVLQFLNDGITDVSIMHDWHFLRKKSTLTTTDATGIIDLPDDLDRMLSLHIRGDYPLLARLQPQAFENAKEDDSIDESTFYCITEYEQTDTSSSPHMTIEIWTHPSSGAVFQIWYIKHVDEILECELDQVPNIPPYLWDLVERYAQIKTMEYRKLPEGTTDRHRRMFDAKLDMCKKREDMGATRYSQFGMDPALAKHYQTRFT